ncbi:OB-fold nucleic acid binding domain-containing protein, partial [Arthrospira platensis SPKY1]|nr:OB-fold nucleic acid binding domain-containing protein [Arthrospira platensis SPKY1]
MVKLTEQEIIRRENLQKIIELGIDPYPADTFEVNATSEGIKANYNENAGQIDVTIAGRLMMVREMGKASFAELQDSHGKIQLYINRDQLCPGEDKTLYNVLFKKLLDI